MATRDYFAVFGSGNPVTRTGLAPTFITFVSSTGAAGTAPAITEPGSKGIYKFSYDASATLIVFTLDGATTGVPNTDRYVSGILEAQDAFGVTLSAVALSIGSTASSFGSTGVDPGDLYGFMKRSLEMAEGNQTYTKATGLLDFYSRGSSTLLREKNISDSASTTTKT